MTHFLKSKLGEPKHVRAKFEAVGKRGVVLFEGVHSLHGGSKIDLWDGTETAGIDDSFAESDRISLWIFH